MNEQTIIVHDGHKRNPTVLNRAQYDALCASGMMWEFHPDAPLKWPFPVKAVQPTATATPRTDSTLMSRNHLPEGWPDVVAADHARTLERELSSAQAALAEAKADNESLRTLWTEIRTVLIQSRAANCVCSYGAQQADAVEAANAVLKRMPPDVTNERDQLRARVAELEADRAEWSVIYKRDYGHDWATRGNYKGF